VSRQVAVATTSPLAAQAALQMAEAGGNAVDAAVAASLVSMVAEPGIVALAGAAFVTAAPADRSAPVTYDGNVEMPGRGLPPDRFGRGVRKVQTEYGAGVSMVVGHGSVATPGALAALDLAQSRHGAVPWEEVVAPAYDAARAGFPLGSSSAYYLDYVRDSVFGWHLLSRTALHHADGSPIRAGETVRVADLAESLRAIAEEGAQTLYRGHLAELVVADMEANDGILTREDLAAYEPVARPALVVPAGSWSLATNPPPSIGGSTLAAMLRLMAGRPSGPWTADDVAHVIAVQDAVLSYRLAQLDLADDLLRETGRLLEEVSTGGLLAVRTSPSTVNVSVVDSDGGACTITSSAGYGSGVMTPGTGLWLNNCLGEPELNRGGLHSLPPGRRLPSNMAPTVGLHDDGSALAIGSPGADRITTALLQVLSAFVHGGMSLEDAIAAPRVHVAYSDADTRPVVHFEADATMPDNGHQRHGHHATSMFFGGVGAALCTPDGRVVAAGDPRRAAVVATGPQPRS
jgi:gamma-glutamyltranspeptidase/glutathione hydrolase